MKKLTIYDKCLKENTFLSTFCKQCSNINTPTIFDFWQGMYCLSSILNRNVVIEIDDKLIFPNIYCLFVSDNSEFLENAQKVLSKKSKTELSRSSNKSTKTRIAKSKTDNSILGIAKSKTDNSTLDIWLQ